MIKKNKTKTKIAKGVLLISFTLLFLRLIYSSINAFYHNKNYDKSNSSYTKVKTIIFLKHKNYKFTKKLKLQ